MTRPLKNIFVPVNFSDSADSAIYAAVAMCKRHNATLHLLHIQKERMFLYPPVRKPWTWLDVLKSKVDKAGQLEKQTKQIQEESNITCFFHTDSGTFHEVLATKTKDFYCDLIILQKSSDMKPFSLSNHNAYNILKHVSCSVLIIPSGRWSLNFKNIFFPVRPIQSGLQKLEVALPIIEKNQAKVSLFGALKNLSEMSTASKFIQQLDKLLSKDKIKVETEINTSDNVAKEVVKRAIEKDSDLIIISTTIQQSFAALFSSSYTERVINRSPIPVLSVKI